VQKPDLSERDIRAALTLSVAINALLFALMWLLAPLAGRFFWQPGRRSHPARSVGSIFAERVFRDIAWPAAPPPYVLSNSPWSKSCPTILGYGVVGIGSAFQGFGVWSLVFAVIGQEGITLAASYAFVRHSLLPLFAWHDIRHFLHYGGKYSAIGFLEYIGANVDSLLIGRWYGETRWVFTIAGKCW